MLINQKAKFLKIFHIFILFKCTLSFAELSNNVLYQKLDNFEVDYYIETTRGFYYFGTENKIYFSSKGSSSKPSLVVIAPNDSQTNIISISHYSRFSLVSTSKNTYVISQSAGLIPLNIVLASKNLKSNYVYDPLGTNIGAGYNHRLTQNIYEYSEGLYLEATDGVYKFSQQDFSIKPIYKSNSLKSFVVKYESPFKQAWSRIEFYDQEKLNIYTRQGNKKIIIDDFGGVLDLISNTEFAWIIMENAVAIWSFKHEAVTYLNLSKQKSSKVFTETSDYLWKESTNNKLLRFDKSTGLEPQEIDIETNYGLIVERNNTVFVFDEPYLLVLGENGVGSPRVVSSNLNGETYVFEGKSGVWIAGTEGIYLWQDAHPNKIENRYKFKRNGYFLTAAGQIYGSVTDKGVYIVGNGFDPIYHNTEWSENVEFEFALESLIFTDENDLYVITHKEPNKLNKLKLPFNTKTIKFQRETKTAYLFYGDGEVYEIDKFMPSKNKVQEISSEKIDPLSQLHDDLWINYHSPNIFTQVKAIKNLKKWKAKFVEESEIPNDISLNQEISLSWSIDDYHGQSDPSKVGFSAILKKLESPPSKDLVAKVIDTQILRLANDKFRLSLPPIRDKGFYRLEITAHDIFGNKILYNREFWVGRTSTEIALNVAKNVGSALLLLNILSFLVLVFLSRWFSSSFELLTNPVFRKLGIYFGLAFSYIRPLRLWVLRRYFDSLKKSFSESSIYLPATILRDQTSIPIKCDDLLDLVNEDRIIWLSGESGCGKTELVNRLMRIYTSSKTLSDAWNRFKFIPILVSARNFNNINTVSYDWLPEAARLSLSFYGLKFEDKNFFQNLLLKGDFLIIVDGMNEVARDDDFHSYTSIDKNTKFLTTSQTTNFSSKIHNYFFQTLRKTDVQKLIKMYIGDSFSNKNVQISESLLVTLSTPYEIKLLSELIANDEDIPSDRMSLYKCMIKSSIPQTYIDYPLHSICRKAWSQWKDGERAFELDNSVTNQIIEPLLKSKVVVRKSDKYEFRHDLIRAFLAANWATVYSTNIEQTMECLSESKVFTLSSSEQDLVFPFLVRLIDKENIVPLTNYALKDPNMRSRLLLSLSNLAKELNLEFETKFSPPELK